MLKTDTLTLAAVQQAVSAMSPLLSNRGRNMRYTFGDQWSDLVPDSTGRPVREGDYAAGAGAHPITNNLIRPLVKTIVGRYRTDRAEYYKKTPLGAENSLAELDARMLEEYLISGCAVQRIHPEERPERTGVWVDNVSPAQFFVNRHYDPRGTDVTLVGMRHKMTLNDILNRFARGSRDRVTDIVQAYAGTETDSVSGLYSVLEVWTIDSAPMLACHDEDEGTVYDLPAAEAKAVTVENISRRKRKLRGIRATWYAPTHWHCRWLAPGGEVLDHYPSPFVHGSHPFAFKLYPLTDGKVHPFVEDLIEQQRAINRMVTLTDHMMATSAKGVLLFPVDAKMPDMKWEDITARWSACDGVIPIRQSAEMPRQMTAGNFSSGVGEVLATQLELFRLTSGVSAVLTGQEVSASRGASMYEQQVSNSVAAIADLLESFASLIELRNRKITATATKNH